MLINFFLIVILSISLAFVTDLLLKSIKKITQLTGIRDFTLANSLIAFGTSLPELSIAFQSAMIGQSSLSLGNVLGSNIANLSIVIGGGALIGGSIKISKTILNKNVYYTFLVAISPLILLIDGQLDIFDGIILIIVFLVWKFASLANDKSQNDLVETPKIKVNFSKIVLPIFKIILSLAGLIMLSSSLVGQGIIIADEFKIPPLIVGIFLTGFGSSLPELLISIKSAKDKIAEIALGNILGSIAFNSSLAIAVNAVLDPFTISQPEVFYTATLFFLIVFLLFYIFVRTKETLNRWEGAVLLTCYLALIAFGVL